MVGGSVNNLSTKADHAQIMGRGRQFTLARDREYRKNKEFISA